MDKFIPTAMPEMSDPDKHKKILERYLPEDRDVNDLDLFTLSRLPITLQQKIVIAKDVWKKMPVEDIEDTLKSIGEASDKARLFELGNKPKSIGKWSELPSNK